MSAGRERSSNWRAVSRELLGEEKRRAINALLDWMVRDVGGVSDHDYPLARWARAHSARLAQELAETEGYYRNTKPSPRGRR